MNKTINDFDNKHRMKYKLSNTRIKVTDIEYLNDLRTVANRLEKRCLKQRDYSKKNGAKYSLNSAIKRFGNWDTLLKKAGLEGEKSLKGMEYGEKQIKDEVLLADLVRVSGELGKSRITISEYEKLGKYTAVTMHTRFGSWNRAKQKANLETISHDYTTEELFQNILDLWALLGRQPKFSEVIAPDSKFHGSTYARRFGSWRSALEAFVDFINSDNTSEESQDENLDLIPINISNQIQPKTKKELKTKRTSRSINLRLRWIILQRDNFSCRKCGQSPAKDQSVILHVDHIIPWSKNGETVIENLETLCERCNLGKSNLI